MAQLPPGFVLDGGAKGSPVYGAPPKAAPPPTPFQIEDQGFQREAQRRADEAAARAATADARSAEAAQRSALEWTATHNPDGTAKPNTTDPKITEYQAKAAGFLGRMIQANSEFEQVPEGSRDARTVLGQWFHDAMPGVENSLNSPERQMADQAARNFIAASLRQESGAAISAGEFENQYRIFFPAPGDGPEVLAQKAEARKQAIEGFRVSAGPLAAKVAATAQPPAVTGSMATPDFGEVGAAPAPPENGQRLVGDPETQSHVDAMLRSGASYSEVNQYAASRGMAPVNPQQYAAARKYLRAHPDYAGSMVNAHKYEPLTTYEKVATAIGDNPVGTFALNSGQFLSGNTLDNMAGDPEQARQALDYVSARNPNAALAGQIGGGVLAGLTGEAGLARLGMAPGVARAGLADIAMGGANGAGAADNGNRLTGGLQGAALAAAGSLTGQAAMRVAGAGAAPTGGRLADLYDAGVRPTIGQRVANAGNGRGFAGMAGKTVNAVEEALQSVPVVGSAIRGARQEARDQFQIGAFNESLREIGEELPKGMRPGTDPHKFTQEAFNRTYDKARSGMEMVADKELADDLGQLAPDIATLGPQAQGKLKAIMANSVNNKIVNGRMAGDGYKRAQSDLGKHIARLGKSAMSEDQQLAEVLSGVQSAIDAAARRSSHPDAVALLDAADAGYAKLVRIEEAAARRGGDAGTFTPAGFDSSVQKSSGGVRSKAYLRGDANMQDYAAAGRSLEDRLPNSGTADRAMLGQVATGGAAFGTATGAVSPLVLGTLGAIGAAYAPGVRKIMQEALAPTSNATLKAISSQLKKRARLVGAVGATSAVALPGTSPGQ